MSSWSVSAICGIFPQGHEFDSRHMYIFLLNILNNLCLFNAFPFSGNSYLAGAISILGIMQTGPQEYHFGPIMVSKVECKIFPPQNSVSPRWKSKFTRIFNRVHAAAIFKKFRNPSGLIFNVFFVSIKTQSPKNPSTWNSLLISNKNLNRHVLEIVVN